MLYLRGYVYIPDQEMLINFAVGDYTLIYISQLVLEWRAVVLLPCPFVLQDTMFSRRLIALDFSILKLAGHLYTSL